MNKAYVRYEVYKAYQNGGRSTAILAAKELGLETFEYCGRCGCDSPSYDHECLICGQETWFTKTEEKPDDLFQQVANISKAHAYDIVSKQVQELKDGFKYISARLKALHDEGELNDQDKEIVFDIHLTCIRHMTGHIDSISK